MTNPTRELARLDRAALWRRRRALGAAIALAVSCGGPALAVDNLWTGAISTDWNTAGNWSLNRVPANPNPDAGFDDAVINIAGPNTATISADPTATPRDILVGNGVGTTGVLNHNAGTAATGPGNWMVVGREGGTGTYNLTGTGSLNVTGPDTPRLYIAGRGAAPSTGTVNVNTTGTLTVGNDLSIGAAGGTGTLNLNAGTVAVGSWLSIGRDENNDGQNPFGGTGNLNQTGGTLTVNGHTILGLPGTTGNMLMTGGVNNTNGEFWVGNGTNAGTPSVGVATVNGGTITVNNWVAVGREGARGTLNVGGTGTVTEVGGGNTHFTIGTGAGGTGIVNVSGGGTLATNGDLILAENNATAVGTFNQTGGTVRVGGNLDVQRDAAVVPVATPRGTYSLSGGTLSVDGTIDTAVGVFSFTGGRITRSNGGVITVNGPLTTGGTPATIDLDNDKTFDVNGALNVVAGNTFDLTGLSVTPGVLSQSFTLGTVDSIVGTFAPPLHAVTGFNSGGATFISELNGENGIWAGPSVFWLQEAGGRVSLEYRAVPEPGSLAVLGLSALALLARRRQT